MTPAAGHTPTPAPAQRMFDDLRFHWDEAYEITYSAGVAGPFRAKRLDNGRVLSATTPARLRDVLIDDYSVQPVPRDVTTSGLAPAAGQNQMLGVLRLAWGDAYDIGCRGGRWVAASRDDGRVTFAGGTPEELNQAVRADWARGGAL